MNLTFLGTSAGCPTKSRNVSGLALTFDQRSDWALIDCGEATQHQLLRASLSSAKLSRIFVTHLHGDHCYGLPGLLGTRTMQGITAPLDVYGPIGIKKLVTTILNITGQYVAFPLRIVEIDGPGVFLTTPTETVEAIAVAHDIPCFAFLFRESDKPGAFLVDRARALGIEDGPVFGRLKRGERVRLEDGRVIDGATLVGAPTPGRRLLVSGDNDQPQVLRHHLEHADLLVHEATFTEKTKTAIRHWVRHATAGMVAREAESAGVPNLILTHFSPRYANQGGLTQSESLEDLKSEAAAYFSGQLFLARDFDRFALTPDRRLTRLAGPSRKATS